MTIESIQDVANCLCWLLLAKICNDIESWAMSSDTEDFVAANVVLDDFMEQMHEQAASTRPIDHTPITVKEDSLRVDLVMWLVLIYNYRAVRVDGSVYARCMYL